MPTDPATATPKRGGTKKWWSSGAAIAITLFLYIAAQLIGGLLVGIYPYSQHWSAAHINEWLNGVYVQFLFVLIAEALTFGGLVWFMRWRLMTLKDVGWRRFRAMNIAYALSGFAVYFIAYLALANIASKIIPDLNVNQQQDVGFSNVTGFLGLAATFISLVILPPLVEETLFRGFLFTTFRRRMKFVWATLLTSLLFAMPHLLESQGGGLLWIGAIDTFTLSLVLCTLREKTGSLWSGVLVHALKNGVAFLSLYIYHIH